MRDDGPVERGFPHLATVRSAVTALWRRLSWDTVGQFGTSVAPAEVAFGDGDELFSGAQRVARAVVGHFRLPDARVIVSFRDMRFAANVELEAGPEYFVELNARFKEHRRDVGAALAHEVTHVYLHRLGLEFPGTRDNEILTDTVSAYLGAGWLLLDAFRQDAVSSQKLGYLTPEEFGYVLAKRAEVFGEDPRIWFTSPQAFEAYEVGAARARRDGARPPLAGAGWAGRRRYARERRRAELYGVAGGGGGVAEGDGFAFVPGEPLRVSFACPRCLQRIRVPVRGRLQARCGVCGAVLECET